MQQPDPVDIQDAFDQADPVTATAMPGGSDIHAEIERLAALGLAEFEVCRRKPPLWLPGSCRSRRAP